MYSESVSINLSVRAAFVSDGLTIVMNSAIIHISVSSLVSAKNSLTELSQCHLHLADGTFFVFRSYFGHKLAVLRGCWLLLYIKAASPSKNERSMYYAKLSGQLLNNL